MILIVEVERLIENNPHDKSAKTACKKLSHSSGWDDFLEEKDSFLTTPDPAEAVRQVY